MGIFDIFKRKTEKRARIDDPRFWSEFFSRFGISKSGQNITPDTAMKSTAVYACIRVLAETIASLPLMIYKRTKKGREVYDLHELYYLLHDQPNPEMTSFEFFEMMMGHLCLRGNAYNFKEMTNGQDINALYPLNPSRMFPFRQNDKIVYRYTHENGKSEDFPGKYIWHLKALATDPYGLLGLSPITLAREAIGLGMAAEDYGSRFFANYARPSGVLEYPGQLTNETAKQLKESWESAFTGENAHRVAVLGGNLKWTSIGMNNEDAQFLELRNYQIEDIARIFRVPCVLLQHADKTSTYASAEQFFLNFVVHTVRPWTARIEQSISKSLLNTRDKKKYYAEFKLDGLLRGDIKARYDAYSVARQWGWLSVNDIRELENLNPIDNGDKYLTPMNMQEAGTNQGGD